MDKRFEESFNELGLIYEAFAKKASGQQDSFEDKNSYKKGLYVKPGSQPSQYNLNNTAPMGPVSDEEKEVDPIIVKLEELQKEAEEHGQDFALLQLATLKKFIEDS